MIEKKLTYLQHWVDICLSEPGAAHMDVYREHGIYLGLQECVENLHQATGVVPWSGCTLIFWRYLHAGKGSHPENSLISFLLTQDVLYSLHPRPLDLPSAVETLLVGQPGGESLEAPRVLLVLLETAIKNTANQVNRLWQQVADMRNTYLEKDELVDGDELLERAADVRDAREVVWGQQRVLRELQVQAGRENLLLYPQPLAALCARLDTLERQLAQAEGGLSELQEVQHQELLQHSHDCTVRQTRLCAVFLPLIFIASVYAMRFQDMVELESAYGYPVCLGVMGVVALLGWYMGGR